ncbi:MAG: hypothetical protein AAGA05_00830 [Pseudomonadota bacterium]
MRFTDLFSAFGASWPEELVNTAWPPTGPISGPFLTQIDDAIRLHDVITDISPDGMIGVTASLQLEAGIPPARTELVSRLFPSLRFVFAPDVDWSSDFRCAIASDGTASVQIDSLPLEVMVPTDLLSKHPTKNGADTGVELAEGAQHSVISRTFSLTLEANGEMRLDPHLPISIGPCKLFGIATRAVHELVFLASPRRARARHHWIVRELDPENFPFDCGGLGFGGIEFDRELEDGPLSQILASSFINEDAAIVIEDVVLPAMFLPPVPQHGTIGIRRNLDPGESLSEHLNFSDAPIKFPLGDSVKLFFDQLYFQTPPEEQPLSDGLTLEAGLAIDFGSGPNEDWDFSIGLIDGDLMRLSIARTPPPAGTDALPLLSLDVWAAAVDVIRARVGVSISELQKNSPDAGKAIQAIGDILIREKPDSEGESVQIQTDDDKPFEAALVDVGWDRGKISGSFEKIEKVALEMGPFTLELREVGLVAEQGATYINISGGIRQNADPLEGKIWFERLRGRLAGNPDAPDFKIGGFGAELKYEDIVQVSVHGHFRNDVLSDGTRIREHGLGGAIKIKVGDNIWGLSTDIYWGDRTPPTEPRIDYLLFQVALFGAIPMGPLELRGIEALYADNLLPRIDDHDREAGELKYYPWLKKSRPTAPADDRGLGVWTPELEAWAFGAGLSMSFAGCGELFLASAFALGFVGEEESGLVVVAELKILGGDEPIAIAIVEYDFRRDILVVQVKLDLNLQDIIENFPDELKVKLGGTITIGNRPGLVAIGRLADEETWLGAKIEIELSDIAEMKIRIALCFEWLEGEHVGGGLIFSQSVRGDIKVIRLEGWGSLSVLLRWMLTGTNDFVARIAFEMGFALVLFGFLRFGISMSLLAEWLAHVPNFFLFRATFRLETPWFLPDVSVTVEATSGSPAVATRSMLTGALLDGSATSRAGSKRLRLQRLDNLEGGEQLTLQALATLPASGTTWQGESEAVAVDGVIEIQFSQMLIDRLGIGSVNPDLGRQVTGGTDGELKVDASYALVGLEVRRRPVGTTDWTVIETITGPMSSRAGRWLWDEDTRTGGETAPKKLLYNGATPFSVNEANPMADAEIVAENPEYPCCRVREPDVARLDFCDDPAGALVDGFLRGFSFLRRGAPAPVRFRGGSGSIRPPMQPGADCPIVAAFPPRGLIASVFAEEDLARVELRYATIARALRLSIIARDALGETIDRIDQTLGSNSSFSTLAIDPGTGFRSVDIVLTGIQEDNDTGEGEFNFEVLELEWIECITAADRQTAEIDRARCDRIDDEGHAQVSAFLPQHEYEIAVSTEVVISTTNAPGTPRRFTERLSFVTAGLPGLNESPEPGLELRPYVTGHPAGGRGLLYREESVHLTLSPSMTMFGPGASGSDEAGFRQPVTLTVATTFDTDPASGPGKSSFESAEWFLANRAEFNYLVAVPIHDLIEALTEDPRKLRYKALSEISAGDCAPDDVWNEQRPRLGLNPFDPSGRALWQPATQYRASMRPSGGPVVHRAPFEPGDVTAFATTTGTWEVNDNGELVAGAAAMGGFGEPDWDLFSAEAVAHKVSGTGANLSLAVLVNGSNPGGGVRLRITVASNGSGTLTAEPLGGGPAIEAQPIATVPEIVSLRVEVFADTVRASAAGATLNLSRSGYQAGSCQIGASAMRIASLRVRALEMYGFDFNTSRYESFGDHISSAGEQVSDLPIAPGAAEPLSTLVSRLSGQIARVMTPEASNSEREAVFAEAGQALAVPLREDPDRLHVDLAENGGDRWLVLESSEPIDFVEETDVSLRHRIPVAPIDHPLLQRLQEALRKYFDPRADLLTPLKPFRIRPPFDTPFRRPTPMLGPLGRTVLDRPKVDPITVVPGARETAHLSVRLAKRRFVITLLETGEMENEPISGATQNELRQLMGVELFFDRFGRLVDWERDDDSEWHPIRLRIIQNGDATKALLLTRQSGELPAGSYRLSFEIMRRWFATTAPPGPGNAYIRDAEIEFQIM